MGYGHKNLTQSECSGSQPVASQQVSFWGQVQSVRK